MSAFQRPWTPAEVAQLGEHYPSLGPRPVARMLDRSPDGVRDKAASLGIRVDRPTGDDNYRRVLRACRVEHEATGKPPRERTVAERVKLSRCTVSRYFTIARARGDWAWGKSVRVETGREAALRQAGSRKVSGPIEDGNEPDPTPEELAGIEARLEDEYRAKAEGPRPAGRRWTVPQLRVSTVPID